ncbi:MAG: sigma-70 family RNA polymerase sigma factor [Planctomycetaceae bacterium]|nr:sigma-70 family RNA polymerase sigma factor [Planctomycetaceae bacterium]
MALMAPDTSTSLLRRLVRQDGAAWKLAYAYYWDLILKWCRLSGCSDADAEEIAQESMTRVLQQLESFQHPGTPGAFRGWLRTIARNQIADNHRDRIRPVGAGDSSFRQAGAAVGGVTHASPSLDHSLSLQQLILSVTGIGANTARSFVEFVICGRAATDIAAEADPPIQVDTVYQHVKRAAAALRDNLDSGDLSDLLRRAFPR